MPAKLAIPALDDDFAGGIGTSHGFGGFHGVILRGNAMNGSLDPFLENQPIPAVAGEHKKPRD